MGEDIGVIPEGLYPGDYLISVGEALAQKMGDKWLDADEDIWLGKIRTLAISMMMDTVREDLDSLGIHFDVFASENSLVETGAVDKVLSHLDQMGLIYTGVLEPPKGKTPDDWEPREQT